MSANRRILDIALPSILSNVTVPLLGLIDVAIVGHLGAPAYIGAIAVGGMLFNTIYWLFGFLRMGTSGLTSQAYGQQDRAEAFRLLLRAAGTGVAVGLVMILLQQLLLSAAFALIEATPEVEQLATRYFRICIWGAPATLGLYALTGWFIGMQNSRFPLYIAIVQNLTNIAASLCLVYLCHMKVEGVAAGTLIAQYAGLCMAVVLYLRHYHTAGPRIDGAALWEHAAIGRFFRVNRDIFLRTLCLVSVTLFFTAAGAAQGEVVLAVNTLLMQLFTLFSYVMDGFAYAGEALTGRYIGARDRTALHRTTLLLFRWGATLALLFTLVYAAGGDAFLALLTNDADVIAAADSYFCWALAIPVTAFAAFLWDGIFIGATATRPMLHAMAVAAAGFFALYHALAPLWGNHALWLAFLAYLGLRSLIQSFGGRQILRAQQA